MNTFLLNFFLLLFIFSGSYTTAQISPTNNIIYVKENATDNGSSWSNPANLAKALQWAQANKDNNLWDASNPLKIYVAKGQYIPEINPETNSPSAYFASFLMVRDVKIYGGFPDSGQPTIAGRDWEVNETILKGNDNGYSLVISAGFVGTALLDGFTIKNGKANGYLYRYINGAYIFGLFGGGIHIGNSSPTLNNLIVKDNQAASRGGGIYTVESSAILTNITIANNRTTITGYPTTTETGRGGGIASKNSSLTLEKVTITNNLGILSGGGMYNEGSSPTLKNVTIRNNVAEWVNTWTSGIGGGMHNDLNSSPILKNVIISGNRTRSSGGGIANTSNSSPTLTNVLICGNLAENIHFSDTYYSFGGGISNQYNSSPTLKNVTIINNRSFYSGAIYNYENSTAYVFNSIVWGNSGSIFGSGSENIHSSSSSNIIQSIVYGSTIGNIPGLPSGLSVSDLFINPISADSAPTTLGNYKLKINSLAINAGDNLHYTDFQNDYDLSGSPRLIGDFIDLGAYEYHDLPILPNTENILYVNQNAIGSYGTGENWANAVIELADALKFAKENQNQWTEENPLEIWVAEGTYNPMYRPDNLLFQSSNKRLHSFAMVKNVKIHGGFTGTETELSQRDWKTNETILSGDLNDNDEITGSGNDLVLSNISDNSYHVVIASNDLGNAAIDGFTITGGNANSSSTLNVNSYSITLNNGGGLIAVNVNSASRFSNLKITGNNAGDRAGGFYNYRSPLVIEKVIFSKNRANYGSALFNETANTTVINSLFAGNRASNNGGAIYSSSNSVNIINSTFYNNHAGNGGAIYNRASTAVANSIIWGNSSAIANEGGGNTTTIEYSIVQGGFAGNGNKNVNPLFTNAGNGNYTLKPNSPAVNTGNNSLYPGLDENTLDLAGNPRLFGTQIDMGAYELQSIPSDCPDSTIWNGISWSNGEPYFDKKAIIDGELILSSDLTACELEVTANGSLEIPSGFTFTVNGKIINNAAAQDFVVADNGNLIQIENIENTEEITVHRDSNPMVRLDYTLWSPPVINQNLFNFSPETVNGITNYPGSTGRIYVYNGTNGYVNPDPFDENSVMNSGVGYLFRSPNNFNSSVPAVYEGIFTGIPFNGDLSVATVAGNYTSIGNPYPSNIHADDFISANPGISTLYFWNNNHSAGNNYATCTLGNCVAAAGGGSIPDGIISVGQGFIVTTSDVSVNFDNSMRTNDDADFFKVDQTERHRFWLNLNGDESQAYNQILVSYMDGATNGIDNQMDGRLFGYEGSALYNLINGQKFTIQGRAFPFEASDGVPLGFRAVEDGKFKISLDHFDGLFAEGNITIYLKDNALHIIHNLMESGYEFESIAGEFNDRFEIVYQEEVTMGTDDLTSDEVQIYKDNDFIVVESGKEKILSVELFDLSGRNIHSNNKVNANFYKTKSSSKGVLIIRVQTRNGEIKTKKAINN